MNIKQNLTTINQWMDRSGYNIEGVILHSMWGTYNGSISWFKNPKAVASAHYCIKSNGEITLCVEESHAAWHAGIVTVSKEKAPELLKERWAINPNFITIGIEFEDLRQKNRVYPDPQYLAGVELVADICKRYNIKPDRGHIMMHKETDPVNRTDPVGKWNQDKFIQDVALLLEAHDDGYTALTVIAKAGLNVREKASLYADIKYFLTYGKTVFVKGFVLGETILDNNKWWKTKDNLFVWSGGTSMVPTDMKGLDMTVEERDQKLKELEARAASIESRRVELEEAVKANQEDAEKYKVEWEAFAAAPVEEPVVEVVPEPVVETPVEPVVEVTPEPVVEEVKPVESTVDEETKTAFAKLMEEFAVIKVKLGL